MGFIKRAKVDKTKDIDNDVNIASIMLINGVSSDI